MRAILVVVLCAVISACSASKCNVQTRHVDYYDDGEDYEACMIDNRECLIRFVVDA